MQTQKNIEAQHAQDLTAIKRMDHQAELMQWGSFLGELGGMMGEFYDQSGGKAKAFFYLQKALTVAQIIMNTEAAASNAMKNSFMGIDGLAESAVIRALGYANAGMVSGMTIAQSFGVGGKVRGYSPNSRADNIPAWLTAKEFVHPVDTVDYYGDGVMEAIRTKKIPREVLAGYSSGKHFTGSGSFNNGGSVSGGAPVGGVNITINGGDEASVKKAIPHLISAVKKAINDDIRNDGETRKTILTYGR